MTSPLLVSAPEGSITVTAGALTRLVADAAELVDGARVRRRRRGLEVLQANGRATVSLELAARYGAVLPGLAHEVQERVAAALAEMCGLEVDCVDVTIEEIER